jgi:hypothetical protein
MSNSQYAKGLSDTSKLTSGLIDLNDELKLQRLVIKKNNKAIEKQNEIAEKVFVDKVSSLEAEVKALKSQTWVETSESAIKLSSNDLIKKLNVL